MQTLRVILSPILKRFSCKNQEKLGLVHLPPEITKTETAPRGDDGGLFPDSYLHLVRKKAANY